MAGVNNVSTYDNAPENPNNTVERTTNNTAADDSDDQDRDSLQNFIDDELSRRLNEHVTPADRVKCSVDMMLAAESIHGEQYADDAEYADLRSLSTAVGNDGYQVQRDASELMLLTETRHAEETAHNGCSDAGLGSVSETRPIRGSPDTGGPLSSNPPSSGFEDGGDATAAVEPSDRDPLADEQRRVFTRPLPADDETDDVQTELVFHTWTTADQVVRETDAETPKFEMNGFAEKSTSDISHAAASPNLQECFDVNTPAIITNTVVSFVWLITNIYRGPGNVPVIHKHTGFVYWTE